MSRTALVLAFGFVLGSGVVIGMACSKKNAEVEGTGHVGPVASGSDDLPILTPPPGGAKGGHVDTAPPGDDKSFKLAVTAPAAGPAGAQAVAHVSVTPSAGWHVNKDYPTKLALTAPDGVALQKAVLEVADVTKLDETELAFDVKLTAAKAGTYKVDGQLKFAVCTPETCDPKQQTIAIQLVAQ